MKKCATCNHELKPEQEHCPNCETGSAQKKLQPINLEGATPPGLVVVNWQQSFAPAVPQAQQLGVRSQIFEIIVRQALNGVDWRVACKDAMETHNILPEKVDEELRRRLELVLKQKSASQ